MKLAKFIYPMFLVAIGLHGLLLFVPLGGTSDAELIEEDVALSELPSTAESTAKPEPSEPAGPLPVPNLNLATGAATSAKPAAAAAAARATPTPRSAARPSAATGAAAARSRTRTTQAAAPESSSPRRAAASASSVASAAGAGRSSTSSSSTASRNAAPRTNLPNLNAANSSSPSPEEGNAGSSTASGPLSLSGLIASVTKSAPEALVSLRSDFVEDYTYQETNTDVAGLEDRRSRWIDKVSLLANADSNAASSSAVAEKIEPIVLSDSKLSYPIERSARSDRRASQICLDDPVPNDAEVAVLFDAQGNVVGTPEMTRSSGYLAIDKEIMAIVLAEETANAPDPEGFAETRQAKAYLRGFEIDYAADRCLTLPKLKK